MLKIHCWLVASQKAVSGVVEETLSSTAVTAPEMILVKKKLLTTPRSSHRHSVHVAGAEVSESSPLA
jgi:hypothetical protein